MDGTEMGWKNTNGKSRALVPPRNSLTFRLIVERV